MIGSDSDRSHQRSDNDHPSGYPTSCYGLPPPLRLLFALNGATLQLPALALLSIVNDRASIPPTYLPVYGAISFLPWSLKPIYAALSTALIGPRNAGAEGGSGNVGNTPLHAPTRTSRHVLLSVLLSLSGLSYVGTAFVPTNGVASCFVWGFVRGVTSSWPEFLLGVTLIETARRDVSECASKRRSALGGAVDACHVRDDEEDDHDEVCLDCASSHAPQNTQSAHHPPQDERSATPRRRQHCTANTGNATTYEELASTYQSQAATSRNVGSLIASGCTFGLFAYRHYFDHRHHNLHGHDGGDDDGRDDGGNGDNGELSSEVVAALLFGTAALSILGSAIAFRCRVGTFRDDEASKSFSPGGGGGEEESRSCGAAVSTGRKQKRMGRAGRYDEIATNEEQLLELEQDGTTAAITASRLSCRLEMDRHLDVDVASEHGPQSLADASSPSILHDGETRYSSLTAASSPTRERTRSTSRAAKWQHRCDVASIVLFQTLLVLAALQHPIVSITQHSVWVGLIVLGGIGLVVTLVSSAYHQRRGQDSNHNNGFTAKSSSGGTVSAAIPPRRLGLYLTLRHSVPISSMLMYSFVYTLFASNPLYLQFVSIVDSGVSTLATKFYERYLAKRYNVGWSMMGLIALLTCLTSLISLLDLIVVRAAGGGGHDDGDDGGEEDNGNGDGDGGQEADHDQASLRWLVLGVSIVTYFMGELAFMPSVVLATTNVVGSDEDGLPPGHGRGEESFEEEDQRRGLESDDGGVAAANGWKGTDDDFTPSHNGEAEAEAPAAAQQCQGYEAPPYNESMQYASFVSCIDFGAQVGDWISVPIIASLDITRENGWANLDQFIVLCAIARLGSVAFLWLIRPPPTRHPQAPRVATSMTGTNGVLS